MGRHRRQHPVDHVIGRDFLRERVVGQEQPVAEDLRSQVEHVLRRGVGAAAQHCERPGTADEIDRRPRTRAETDDRVHIRAIIGDKELADER